MTASQMAVPVRSRPQVVELDHETKREIVRAGNRIVSIGDVARVAMDEMSTNYVTSEQLAAQALTVAHCMASGVPQGQISEAYLNTLTQHYLQRMVVAIDLANDAILQRIKESFHP
ncbi:MAG: hypothetical protein IT329_24370 [Caldilineaceae bacterium]|nr:hypothetical protein [Caldilineaceae bacterium]